jgi:hypothetical protein
MIEAARWMRYFADNAVTVGDPGIGIQGKRLQILLDLPGPMKQAARGFGAILRRPCQERL